MVTEHLTDGDEIMVREHHSLGRPCCATGEYHCATLLARVFTIQDICFWGYSLVFFQEVVRKLDSH